MQTDDLSDFTNQKYKITIIGLGLIGGSMAKALRGFKNAIITGVDANPQTIQKALKNGAIDRAEEDVPAAVSDADLVIMCVYPHHIIEIMNTYIEKFKTGAVICDVCGTKAALYEKLNKILRKDIDYIGIHPMAGKEIDGFDNSDAKLFVDTGFIITPLEKTNPNSVNLMKKIAAHIGTSRITIVDSHLHDDIIAYTSDLMHISATALCIDFHKDMTSTYTAGAFRDCTRIANINPSLWTELLLTNSKAILPHLENYIENLKKMQKAISTQDNEKLYDLLNEASNNKKEMLRR